MATQSALKVLDKAATNAEARVRVAYKRALRVVERGIQTDAVEAALERGDVEGAVNLVPLEGHDQILADAFRAVLGNLFRQGDKVAGDVVAVQVGQAPAVLEDVAARAWAEQKAAELVVQIGGETRDGIRATIARVFADAPENKITAAQAAKQIKALVGLTEQQAEWVGNFRRQMVEDGRLTPAQMDRAAVQYGQKLLRYRAENIARTETVSAANAGQKDAWARMADEGVIDREQAEEVWSVTDDARLCPICQAADGQHVKVGESFTLGDGRKVKHPPGHPQCRCGVWLDVGAGVGKDAPAPPGPAQPLPEPEPPPAPPGPAVAPAPPARRPVAPRPRPVPPAPRPPAPVIPPAPIPTPAPAVVPSPTPVSGYATMNPAQRTLATAPVSRKEQAGGGINGSYKVTMPDNSAVMWKPRKEESAGPSGYIPSKTLYVREAASYDLADEVGYGDLVPPTTVREIEGEIGSAQVWRGDAKVAKRWFNDAGVSHYADARADYVREQIAAVDRERALALDYVIQNLDRHGGNWMVTKDGKPVLIDHGFALPMREYPESLRFGWGINLNDAVPAHVKKTWTDALARWDDIRTRLKDRGLEDKAIEQAGTRAWKLSQATTWFDVVDGVEM